MIRREIYLIFFFFFFGGGGKPPPQKKKNMCKTIFFYLSIIRRDINFLRGGGETLPPLNTIFCGAEPQFWAEGPITVTRQLGVGPEGPQPKLHPLGRRLESWFGLG